MVTGASQLVATGAVLKFVIIFIKILNTEIVDFVLKKKAMIQDHRSKIYLCLEKRYFKNVGGKINLSGRQAQMAAHSLPDLT